ncbi:hypothetical protein ABMA28_001457 [Loxostege sticticalis]|uniref:Ubiquitin-like domain-containing protein n=1 Tax=Loxostege sticticalis TaxID=481309 RepID=A0ABD0T1R5_LOXSC
MTLIEGFGDEVIQTLGVLIVALIATLAWLSTNARPGRYRTVVVMRPRQHHPVTVSFRTTDNQNSTPQQVATPETVVSPTETVEEPRDTSRVIPLQEMDSIIDADMAMMNNNRLHFYRRLDAPGSVQGIADSTSEDSETQEESEPASNDQIREMDSIVNAMEADVTAGCDFFTRPNESNPTLTASVKSNKNENNVASTASNESEEADSNGNSESQNTDDGASRSIQIDTKKILIKLKYLNDTLKEVEGSLDEMLKDFKWRHFSSELTSECRVRLIFNGRVLIDDSATLRACGLHDRAVVHCLVHPKRNTNQRPEEESGSVGTGGAAVGGGEAAPERAWDLENILMTLVSVALTVVWFFRCEYSNMFTASASVALFGLTVFYSVAIFGLYLSDTFHFDRRPPPTQAIPDN